jgi:hypothetical protein
VGVGQPYTTLADAFRRADLNNLSQGLIRSRLSRDHVRAVRVPIDVTGRRTVLWFALAQSLDLWASHYQRPLSKSAQTGRRAEMQRRTRAASS